MHIMPQDEALAEVIACMQWMNDNKPAAIREAR